MPHQELTVWGVGLWNLNFLTACLLDILKEWGLSSLVKKSRLKRSRGHGPKRKNRKEKTEGAGPTSNRNLPISLRRRKKTTFREINDQQDKLKTIDEKRTRHLRGGKMNTGRARKIFSVRAQLAKKRRLKLPRPRMAPEDEKSSYSTPLSANGKEKTRGQKL